jgi:hypothetical protein
MSYTPKKTQTIDQRIVAAASVDLTELEFYLRMSKGKIWNQHDSDVALAMARSAITKASMRPEAARDRKSIFSSGGGAKLPERNTR